MPTLEEVKTHIRPLEGASRLLERKEIKELPGILEEGEIIKRLVQGSYGRRTGILVATNVRLIFVDKGVLFGRRVEKFPYNKITAIQYTTDSTLGQITIFTSGNIANIEQVEKEQAIIFSKYVKDRITKSKKHASNNIRDKLNSSLVIADQIKKLTDLRDAGLLTDEELLVHEQKILDA